MNHSSSLLPVCGCKHCEAVGSHVCSSPSFLHDAHQTQQDLTWLFRWNVSNETHKCQEDFIIDIMLKTQSYTEASSPLLVVFVVRSALTLGAVSRIGGYIHTFGKKKKKCLCWLCSVRPRNDKMRWHSADATQRRAHIIIISAYHHRTWFQHVCVCVCSVSLNEAQRAGSGGAAAGAEINIRELIHRFISW